MTDMVYYRVTAKSPAAKVLEERFSNMSRQRVIATAVGKEWLGTVDFDLIGSDATIVGFAPKNQSWQSFMKGLPDRKIWVKAEDRTSSWIYPRKQRGNKQLIEAWGAIPAIEDWATTTRKLFGAGRFIHGLRMCGASLWSHNEIIIVGVPWLAAVGVMKPFEAKDSAFKPISGLQRLPLDNAMSIMHADALKALKAEQVKAELKL